MSHKSKLHTNPMQFCSDTSYFCFVLQLVHMHCVNFRFVNCNFGLVRNEHCRMWPFLNKKKLTFEALMVSIMKKFKLFLNIYKREINLTKSCGRFAYVSLACHHFGLDPSHFCMYKQDLHLRISLSRKLVFPWSCPHVCICYNSLIFCLLKIQNAFFSAPIMEYIFSIYFSVAYDVHFSSLLWIDS